MQTIKRLLLENKAWAESHEKIAPDYFENMAGGQNPEILWIGCADSRVPPDQIINSRPGNLFVHRNVANLVYAEDENLMSVLEYAVHYLKVKYIIVCGHYSCGGVKAAFEGIDNPLLSKWTKCVSDLKFSKHPKDINHLVELSVCNQIDRLKGLETVQRAWKENPAYPKLIGWVYDLSNGKLVELCKHDPLDKENPKKD